MNWYYKNALDQATSKSLQNNIIRMYEYQQIWKRYYQENKITKEELDYVINLSGGEIRKV